jgi:hypothetical protein
VNCETVTNPYPFTYASHAHIRKHGPVGYPRHTMYRNWLRDEFVFTCVYCLRRENWATLRRDWEIDHQIAKSIDRKSALDYDNLVYACSTCNRTKATQFAPDPCKVAYGSCVQVDSNGEIHPIEGSRHGLDLIEAVGLDAEDYNEMRRAVFELLADLPVTSQSYERFFGFPKELPDLSKEPLPPGGNKRPAGIEESCFEKSRRGQLPKHF